MLQVIGVKGDEKTVSIFVNSLGDYMAAETKDDCAIIEDDEDFITLVARKWRFSLKRLKGQKSSQLLKVSSHLVPHVTLAIIDGNNVLEDHDGTVVFSDDARDKGTCHCTFEDREGNVIGSFSAAKIEVFHQFLLARQSQNGLMKDFNLHVNNKIIGCNEFVRDVFKRGIVGMISSLKNVERPGKVHLHFFLEENE